MYYASFTMWYVLMFVNYNQQMRTYPHHYPQKENAFNTVYVGYEYDSAKHPFDKTSWNICGMCVWTWMPDASAYGAYMRQCSWRSDHRSYTINPPGQPLFQMLSVLFWYIQFHLRAKQEDLQDPEADTRHSCTQYFLMLPSFQRSLDRLLHGLHPAADF